MPELELTRSREDRKLYVLDGVGTLRLQGWMSRTATAEAEGRSWELGRRGIFTSIFEATDASGTTAGEFRGRTLRRGGTLQWGQRELELRPASTWRSRYALADGERELAIFDGKGWGKRPVAVVIDDLSAIDPGLVLFTAFVVRGLAEDASSSAAGASAAATSASVS
ncbi:MAG: hypothetical protein ABUM26_06890 [Solirubrobacterales bacterium]